VITWLAPTTPCPPPARPASASALSVETFLRHTSLISFNRAALEATGPAVVTLARSGGAAQPCRIGAVAAQRFARSR